MTGRIKKYAHADSRLIRIGNKWDQAWHGAKTRLWDRHAFGSKTATQRLVAKIRELRPDLIHLHNLHGYYLNIEVLFGFLQTAGLPVVWTLHDCWPFTGHCSYFDAVDCNQWQNGCYDCPNKNAYPQTWWLDRSRQNYAEKKRLFTGLENMMIVTPSHWLAGHVARSFLKEYPVQMIHNGIDLRVFKPCPTQGIRQKYGMGDRRVILGVASVWQQRKGLGDLIRLHGMKLPGAVVVLVGLTQNQTKNLPSGMIGIRRTENVRELAELYSAADVFVNPTYVDNFPTTNIEALACGTPVVTYRTGGSPEAVDTDTGIVVEKGNVTELLKVVKTVLENGRGKYQAACRKRAEKMFDSRDRYNDYYRLYLNMIKNPG